MTILYIGEEERRSIKKLKVYAENNKYPYTEMLRLKDGKIPAPGDLPEYTLQLPHFKIVYSVEQHPRGWMKHISVSVAKKGRFPLPEAINIIINEFGFKGKVDDNKLNYVYIDDVSQSINVMQNHR